MKRNIMRALISLTISFGLWLYMVTVVNPTADNTYSGVSVTLQGESSLEERGLMITTKQIPAVTLRMEGSRRELQKLNSSNLSVVVDVSKITEPGEHSLPINPGDVRLPADVSYNAITVTSRNPDQIVLQIKQRITKAVPVTILYSGEVPDGFMADKEDSVLDYNEIQVSGPADVVARIAKAQIEMDLTDKTGTVSERLSFTLRDAQGQPVDASLVTTNTRTVNLSLRIPQVKQVELKLNVIEGGGATVQTSTITKSADSILVSGSEAALRNLNSIDLGTINLGELSGDTTVEFPVVLPTGVDNEAGITEVTVQITFPDLASKTLDITDIAAVNVPSGRKAEIITKSLEIDFRGPKALVDKLKLDHVKVTVDFSNAQRGTATMRVTVTLDDAYNQIGAVGTYTVSATLK